MTSGISEKHNKVTQGWQCPVCGCVWNWFQEGCTYCNSFAAVRHPHTTTASTASPQADK